MTSGFVRRIRCTGGILLFDDANLKQLVFKNKKCQRFFLQLFNGRASANLFILQIKQLAAALKKCFPNRNRRDGDAGAGTVLFRLTNYCTFVAGKVRCEGS